MQTLSYQERRSELEVYFDRTALEAWRKLTSDAPVGRIRATVRAGRKRMRNTLISWLPADLRGSRLLDAGCGTGALSVEAARRGADVLAIDLSPQQIAIANQRAQAEHLPGSITFHAGDMLDPAHGNFDFVVAMDSLIHYRAPDAVAAVAGLAARTAEAIVFTFAPRTPALAAMHALGRVFPRSDRAPAIEPVAEPALRERLDRQPGLADWHAARSERIASGFYTSQAMDLRRK